MKKAIIGWVLFLSVQIVKGQDIIITTQQDTIACKILSISPTHINYEQKIGNQRAVGKFIPVEQVLEYYRDSQPEQKTASSSKLVRPWRVSLQAGYAHLTASTSEAEQELQNSGISKSDAKSHYKHLKNGVHLSGDVHYFFNDYLGAGVKYSFFHSSSDMELLYNMSLYSSVSYYNSYEHYIMGVDQRLYIHYVGPSLITQQWLNKNQTFQLLAELSIGYAYYRDELRISPYLYSDDTTLGILEEGKSLGKNVEVSLAYYPLTYLSVSANVGFVSASFKKLDETTPMGKTTIKLDKDQHENVSRLNASIGVQFHF
ncbi:hypothetical protein FACS1894123_02850 [Bacteroidia bacterium]|nr:hypothetical protein FACS1894123_02850 [Bacteroidia bacterium]